MIRVAFILWCVVRCIGGVIGEFLRDREVVFVANLSSTMLMVVWFKLLLYHSINDPLTDPLC